MTAQEKINTFTEIHVLLCIAHEKIGKVAGDMPFNEAQELYKGGVAVCRIAETINAHFDKEMAKIKAGKGGRK